jgi:hypothetical protein
VGLIDGAVDGARYVVIRSTGAGSRCARDGNDGVDGHHRCEKDDAYEDTAIKKILSPYEDDRSAVTDCVKLLGSTFEGRKAVLIYGFEDPARPLSWLISAFELIAAQHVMLGLRCEAPLRSLVHPVFASGAVYAWELTAPR